MAIFFNGFRHASSHLRLWLTRCQRVFQKTDASVGIKQCIHARRTCLWFELEKKKQNLSCLHTGFYFRVARAMSHECSFRTSDWRQRRQHKIHIRHRTFLFFPKVSKHYRKLPIVSECIRIFSKLREGQLCRWKDRFRDRGMRNIHLFLSFSAVCVREWNIQWNFQPSSRVA